MKTKTLLAILSVATILGIGSVASVQAGAPENIECDGDTLTEVYDNVNVVAGSSCTLNGAVVVGNVQADGATSVFITGTAVGGDVQIKNSTGGALVVFSSIGGSIQATENGGGTFVGTNTVFGDVQIEKNGGAINIVGGNTIFGNLQCKDNATDPVGTASNVVPTGDVDCAD